MTNIQKTILVDAADCLVSGDGKIFEGMRDLLATYPNKKVVLTGANDEQFQTFGLNKIPYEVFTLKHNPEKTSPEYYEMMLAHFGLGKDDVVYFEHNSEAVKSAQSTGILTYLYDNDKKDIEDLKRFLDDSLGI